MIPCLFVGHGGPDIILEENEYTEFLKGYRNTINKPKAIIIFSAHWENKTQCIGAAEHYEMIYDFYGFPKELYKIKYDCFSDKELALKVQNLFKINNIESKVNYKRGIDHGAWTILNMMYPEAKVPVLTMSVNTELSNEEQYEIGKALESLRQDDVLIICSGGIVHNLRRLRNSSENDVDSWAYNFNQWIKEKVYEWDLNQIFNYEKNAPSSQLAVPRNEHFIPLLIAMGAGHSNKKPNLMKSIYQYGNLSLDFWEFT